MWQIGTGYFGCRESDGSFSLSRLVETVEASPVRAIEIKLSQGAKPGLGGVLPGAKVTPEIARIRGVAARRNCISPSGHTAFGNEDSLLDFVERVAQVTGLPVGIKSAVGDLAFWNRLAKLMAETGRGLGFITIDGGEGAPGRGRSRLPITWPCRSKSQSAKCTQSSPEKVCTTRSCLPDRAG